MEATRWDHIRDWQQIVKQATLTSDQVWYIRFEGVSRTISRNTNTTMIRAWLWLKHEAKYHDCIILEDTLTIEFYNGSQIIIAMNPKGFETGVEFDVVRELPGK